MCRRIDWHGLEMSHQLGSLTRKWGAEYTFDEWRNQKFDLFKNKNFSDFKLLLAIVFGFCQNHLGFFLWSSKQSKCILNIPGVGNAKEAILTIMLDNCSRFNFWTVYFDLIQKIESLKSFKTTSGYLWNIDACFTSTHIKLKFFSRQFYFCKRWLFSQCLQL